MASNARGDGGGWVEKNFKNASLFFRYGWLITTENAQTDVENNYTPGGK